MPMAMSNNAVTSAEVDGGTFIYSFGGIDSTKIFSGISNSSFKYDVTTGLWETLPDLPNPTPVIAAGASNVNGLIYIIGGYTVAQNNSESSIEDVHIFDPEIDDYITAGSPIPVEIDDQVQCVYRDSLIFVITGWSNNGNVNNVQIYDTYNDIWTAGTSLPNTIDYKVFGGSGEIIGDTLYYIGGARQGGSFPLTSILRKGYINPSDPTDITWSESMVDEALGYRMAVAKWQNRIFWFGGSSVSYNYDGIAYNGSGGVSAENRIIQYSYGSGLEIIPDVMPALMDLRGLGLMNENEFYLCGGMLENQTVSNKLFKVSYVDTTLSSLSSNNNFDEIYLYPNPATSYIRFSSNKNPKWIELISSTGQTFSLRKTGNIYPLPNNISNGLYILKLEISSFKLNIIR